MQKAKLSGLLERTFLVILFISFDLLKNLTECRISTNTETDVYEMTGFERDLWAPLSGTIEIYRWSLS